MKLFETIRIQDGIPQHLHYHDLRLNHTRKALFGIDQEITLAEHLTQLPPKGLYRAKVIYDAERISTHYYRYRPKSITTLYLVEADIDYSYKYLDRAPFTKLLSPRAPLPTVRHTPPLLTPHSSLLTLHSSPFTLHPSPFTLHPSLFTLHYSLFRYSHHPKRSPHRYHYRQHRPQRGWYLVHPCHSVAAGYDQSQTAR